MSRFSSATLLAAAWTCMLSAQPASSCPLEKSQRSPEDLRTSYLAVAGHKGASGEISIDVPGSPSEFGQWSEPEVWPLIAIHTALSPTGEVLQYSYPQGLPGSKARLWDPTSGQFEDVSMNQDIFCSGMSFLPDGRLFATGGNDTSGCGLKGLPMMHTFDPIRKSWTRLQDMSVARWYPSNVNLSDGSVLILSGFDENCQVTPVMEKLTPITAGPSEAILEIIPEGERSTMLYPRLHLLTSGLVAHVGPEAESSVFDPVELEWRPVADMAVAERLNGVSFFTPDAEDEIMTCGGAVASMDPEGNYVTVAHNSCERIDFREGTPTWEEGPEMHFARNHPNAVVLPDGKVLMVGGGLGQTYEDPVLNPELYDPVTDSWTLLPPQQYGRMYHSTAVLLPDGRVLSAGQDSGDSGWLTEIYEPAYLFQGGRPVITEVDEEIYYQESFALSATTSSDGSPERSLAGIAEVVLMSLGAVTHSTSTGQLRRELEFTVGTDGVLSVMAPATGNHAPPGVYMLFALNISGVPSEATFVRLGKAPPETLFADDFESGAMDAWR